MLRIFGITLAVITAAVIGLWYWWFYGSGLSVQTSYRLAIEHAHHYAEENGIDLSRYNAPAMPMPDSRPSRLYEFSWIAKDSGGIPLTIVVDSQKVDVSVVESPTWKDRSPR